MINVNFQLTTEKMHLGADKKPPSSELVINSPNVSLLMIKISEVFEKKQSK